jgi:exodeoxyribonuclease VII small subunit
VSKEKEKSFEDSAKQLQEIVLKLEDDKIELDKAIDLFSQGVNVLSYCKEKLSLAEGKITELKTGKNGKLVEEILDIEYK